MKAITVSCNTLLFAALLVSLDFASSAVAELPPGAYAALKRDAQEVLHIEIVRVSEIAGDPSSEDPQIPHRCRARVTQVDRSATGYQVGSMIVFDTWSVAPKGGQYLAGAVIPPRMYAGWSGRVFLNSDVPAATGSTISDGDVLQLAAHGQSFEPDRETQRREATRDQARKLFEKMEQRLNQPRMIHLSVSGEYSDDHFETKITMELWLCRRNKVNVQVTLNPAHFIFGDYVMMISNGNEMLSGNKVQSNVSDAPEHLRHQLLFDFVRLGWVGSMNGWAGGDDTQLSHNHIRTADFRLGKRTRSNGRCVQAIHYRAYLAEDETTADIVLYIDAETFLPVRRTVSSERHGRVQEEYEIQPDPKANERLFDLPA